MIKSGMIPQKTSGKWVEDVQTNPDWLVIYAAKRYEDGFVAYDGFKVGTILF